MMCSVMCVTPFLSIQAQDFIEEIRSMSMRARLRTFLSIQAQDFIEDGTPEEISKAWHEIPEHSSSGLH